MRRLFFLVVLWFALVSPLFARPTTVILVRHAEKARGAGKDPALSWPGRKRARALRALLRDAGLTAIYATEFKRTQQTAGPLAQATGLRPILVPAKATPALVAKLRRAHGNVLVVGHSNTLPEILQRLGVRSSPQIQDGDYDNLFLVTPGSPPHFLRLHLP